MPPAGTRCSRASPAPRPSSRSNTCAPCTPRAAPWPSTGWAPHFLLLEEAGELVAACPLYLKDHSYGEYVFDWAWANAYQQHGLRLLPQAAGAIPFTPVPGPRLLARRRRAAPAAAARHRGWSRAQAEPLLAAPALPRRRRRGRGGRGRLIDAQHGPVPLDATANLAVCRLRRLPRQPAARQAQEDPAGTAPRRRSRRQLPLAARRRHRRRRLGLSSTAATPAPTGSTTPRPT